MSIEQRLEKYFKIEQVPNTRGGSALVLRRKDLSIKIGPFDPNGRGRPCRFDGSKNTTIKILQGIIEDLAADGEISLDVKELTTQ